MTPSNHMQRLEITVEGVKAMIADHTTEHLQPYEVVLNPLDCEAIKDELNDHGTDPRQNVLGIVNGCLVRAQRDITRGSARVNTRRKQAGMSGPWVQQLIGKLRAGQALNPLSSVFTFAFRAPWGTVEQEIDAQTLRDMSDAELAVWLEGRAYAEQVVQ